MIHSVAAGAVPRVSLGTESGTSPRLRSACDRCHSQKLRCIRKPGQISCDRCLKLKLHRRCQFSPRKSRASATPAKSCTYEDRHEPFSVIASISTLSAHSHLTEAKINNTKWSFFPSTISENLASLRLHTCLCPSLHTTPTHLRVQWPHIPENPYNITPFTLEHHVSDLAREPGQGQRFQKGISSQRRQSV
ncbi:hypothetical protein F5884DRAFT_762104 [Xylogone sp. PMI_703]|nr:hypothetical protein F5884DRAFT_762104 [Xylogone sp. PMI_703]